MVDAEDIERVSKRAYHIIKRSGIVQRSKYSKKEQRTVGRIGLAQDILRLPSHRTVLFLSGNKLDCRKNNLLSVPRSKRNCLAKISIANVSGYKGVSYNVKLKKYSASLRKNYKKYHLGYFKNPLEAAGAYNKAAIKHFGKKLARLNILD